MSRSPRSAPSKNDRGGGRGGKVIAGNHRLEKAPPETVPEGKVRCPACRNVTGLTPLGYLRGHKDLFGADCWNRAGVSRTPVEVPEVELPPVRTPPRPAPKPEPEPVEAPPVVIGEDIRLLSPNGGCYECGKRIPPMRRLCGRCMARRKP